MALFYMRPTPTSPRFLVVLLVLGRVSNLPTVWSNCLAAWLLAGGGAGGRFASVCLGATLFYIGGMFLNDAFDVEFDGKHRPERPIPSGQISRRAVWIFGSGLLGLGGLLVIPLGMAPALAAIGLVVAIIIYDAMHKRTALAPVFMAACRYGLCVMAASVAERGFNVPGQAHALALAAYVAGLSCLAKGERTGGAASRWCVGLIMAPGLIPLFTSDGSAAAFLFLVPLVVWGAWILWCLNRTGSRLAPRRSPDVSGLLAGIVLVDWLAVGGGEPKLALVFVGLFVIANLLQRLVPAT